MKILKLCILYQLEFQYLSFKLKLRTHTWNIMGQSNILVLERSNSMKSTRLNPKICPRYLLLYFSSVLANNNETFNWVETMSWGKRNRKADNFDSFYPHSQSSIEVTCFYMQSKLFELLSYFTLFYK